MRQPGTTYLIQADGFYGATGNITLSWNLAGTNNDLPLILTQPVHHTVGVGGTSCVQRECAIWQPI